MPAHGNCERVADFTGTCIALGWDITPAKPLWAQDDTDFDGANSTLVRKCAAEGAQCAPKVYTHCSKGKRYQSQGGLQEYGNVQDLQYDALEWGDIGGQRGCRDARTAQVSAMRACLQKPGVANCTVTTNDVCAGKLVAPMARAALGEWGAIGWMRTASPTTGPTRSVPNARNSH